MKRTTSAVFAVVGASGCMIGVALATCYPNSRPSETSCCNPDFPTNQIKTTLDQAMQTGANTFCTGVCTNDVNHCNFQMSATAGCTPSGSYSNVWKWVSNSTERRCSNATKFYEYNYHGVEPTSQGEIVKYIVDSMNCRPPE